VVVSDIHAGCRLALHTPHPVRMDEGATREPSRVQMALWRWWSEFWDKWVPEATRGEPYTVVFNGDGIDGVHHNSVTQISHNHEDQKRIAYELLAPVVERCEGRYYHIRGTEAHVGESAHNEEALAKELGAIPNGQGKHARCELWKLVGSGRPENRVLVHLLHHIGTTGSMAYESSAVHKEMTEAYAEAGRWGRRPPDVIVRSHRHRSFKTELPTDNTRGVSVVTPAWQCKTPFTWKIPGARQSQPQFGGLVIRAGRREEWYVRSFVKSLERPEAE
jgi:hypothetical protein